MNAIMNKTNNGKRLMAAVAVLALIACAFVAIMPASEQVNGAPVADITVPSTATAMDSVDDLATIAAGDYVISSPITLDKNVTIATGVNVYITTGGSLTVPAGFTLTVTGTLSVTDGGVFTFNASEDGYNVAITESKGKISIDETGVANITGTGAGTFIGPNGIFVIGDGQIDVAYSKATDESLGMAITVTGTAAVAKDFGIYSADKLTVSSNAVLTVNSKLKISGTLTNSGSIAVGANGQIEVDSTSVNSVTSAASLADTTATKTFFYGTPQNVTLKSGQTYSITSGSAVVTVGTNVVSLGNIDSETAITVTTSNGTAMSIAGGAATATGTVAMTSGTATVTTTGLGSVLDGYVTSTTFGKSLTDIGAAEIATSTTLKAAVTVYGDKSTDMIITSSYAPTIANGSSLTGTISFTDGTTTTSIMNGKVSADGADADITATAANAMSISCTGQTVILGNATINQPISITASNVILNGTTTFGTAGKITATSASVYCNGLLAGTATKSQLTGATAYYGDYSNLSLYISATDLTNISYKGASAWSVESIEDIEEAISNGFNNFNVETSKTLIIDEPWTLGEGYTIFVTGTITVAGTSTFTIADGAQVIMMVDGAKISVASDARMNVGGDIIGYQGTTLGSIDNSGTVSFDNSAEVKTDLTGTGTYNLSDSMKTVYVREDVNSNLVFLPQQTVIVESGYSITISSTSRMDVYGNLIVEEGASINVNKGGLLYVRGNTASATIDGTVTSNGMSIMTADGTVTGTPLAGVTIDITSAQSDDSVIAINGTLQSRACNGELAIDLKKNTAANGKGSIELAGVLTVATNSMAQFDGMEVLEGGVLTVNGTIGTTNISNAGTVTMNGTSNGTFTVNMEIGGIVDVRSLAGDMTVTDSGMFLTMVRNSSGQSVEAVVGGANADWASVANSIDLSDIKGAYITSDAPYEVVDGYDNRMPVNKMYVSGNLTPVVTDANATAVVMSGTVIVPDLEAETDLNIGKTHFGVNDNSTLDVVGFIAAVDSENSTAFAGNGNITVSEGTIKSLNVIADTLEVTAVHYEALESNVTYNYYTTLAKAIESGATELDAIGDLTILEDVTLPTGVTLTAGNVYVGDEDVQDITFTIENDAEFTAGNVYVNATMDVADTNDIFVSAVYSDTETIDGTHAIYTNLATALANAEDSTVTITKRGDGTVYLSTDATVKEGVTLAIPAGKVLEIKNGITLTVAGTVDNKGDISAYYMDGTTVKEGDFADEVGTGADSVKKAVIALEGGLIQSTLAMDYKDYAIAGAYYTIGNGRTNVITTIERAAPEIMNADARTVETWGPVVGTTATFTGEEYYNAVLYVNGDLTMDSLVLKDTQMTVQADASILNGTFGSAEGTVTFEHVQAAKGFYLADRIVESGDAKTPTLFMNGGLTKDLDADNAFSEALVQFDGVVKIVNVTIDLDGSKAVDSENNAIVGAKDGNVVVASGADVAYAKNVSNDTMVMTLSNLDLTVEGTLTVSNGAQLTSNAGVVNVILGTLAIAERTDSQSAGIANISSIFIGGVPDDITYDSTRYAAGLGSNAVVTGVISGLNTVYLFPGSTIAEKNVDGYYSTTFMVEDSELVTVYSKTQVTVDNIYPTALIGNSLFKGWYYEDANGVMQPAGTNTLITSKDSAIAEYKTAVTIGQYSTVYANVDYDSYMLEFHVDAGVDAIYVDGDIVDSKGLVGQGAIGYPVAWVSAGTHQITVKLSNGYTGVVEMSFGGQTITDGNISITGSDYAGTTYVVSITNIDASQNDPVSPSTGGDDGLGLTDYLLIVLVVLIVVMAIIVAIRLMRS